MVGTEPGFWVKERAVLRFWGTTPVDRLLSIRLKMRAEIWGLKESWHRKSRCLQGRKETNHLNEWFSIGTMLTENKKMQLVQFALKMWDVCSWQGKKSAKLQYAFFKSGTYFNLSVKESRHEHIVYKSYKNNGRVVHRNGKTCTVWMVP